MKWKDRQRRTKRQEFQAKHINVIAPGDENKTRWKVAVFSIVCDISTVFADDPQEATKKLEEGFGRHAGIEGPAVIGFACIQADKPGAKDFIPQWMANMAHMQKAAMGEDKQVIVPKIQVVK